MTGYLGRIRPVQVIDADGYRINVYADGRHKASVLLHAHVKLGLLAAAVLPDSTNRRAKAMDSLRRFYVNDQLGCCVISSAYHQVGLWSAADDTQGDQAPIVGNDSEVLAAYRIWNPGRQDNGCDIPTVLDYTQSRGLPFGGKIHKIDGYCAIDWTNRELVKAAIQEFGSIKFGINLPQEWYDAPDGGTWEPTNSGIIGGHDVPAVDYGTGGVWIATWGGLRLMTWDALLSRQWVEEAYVPLSPDWYGSDSLATNGINAASLKSAMVSLGNGVVPDVGPTPPPGPPSPAGSFALPVGIVLPAGAYPVSGYQPVVPPIG